MPGRSWRAGKPAAMESPKALIAPLKRGLGGLKVGFAECILGNHLKKQEK